MKNDLLVLIALKNDYREMLSRHFEIHHVPDQRDQTPERLAQHANVRAILTNGTVGCQAQQLAVLPRVELICALGAGYENIDLKAARERGIAVGNGAGTNDNCVADHAMALLLAAVRRIVRLDSHTRAGGWRDCLPFPPNFSGKRMGILGMGTIGRKIARRGLGFELEIGYHNRSLIEDEPYAYFGSARELAAWSDYLIVTTPGGPATRHLVDAQTLQALGPEGYLVNVARGSVVNTAALAYALEQGVIAGAGLDVYEGEPELPAVLKDLDNIVLTPHMAGTSPEAAQASYQRFLDNAARYFSGMPLLSAVQF
ncbi:2-hydroxyacid dehydrogenase [Bordetella sp. FB-8]|uniref:2-hydroxyacid dehydrogenase n=1 Tax=Bordetella sp. FB-8 TaxID=1159870 RepID=UPI000370C665|nr:2-hydroxyacid dehydrogenase [Bordetella sp. FB-8]